MPGRYVQGPVYWRESGDLKLTQRMKARARVYLDLLFERVAHFPGGHGSAKQTWQRAEGTITAQVWVDRNGVRKAVCSIRAGVEGDVTVFLLEHGYLVTQGDPPYRVYAWADLMEDAARKFVIDADGVSARFTDIPEVDEDFGYETGLAGRVLSGDRPHLYSGLTRLLVQALNGAGRSVSDILPEEWENDPKTLGCIRTPDQAYWLASATQAGGIAAVKLTIPAELAGLRALLTDPEIPLTSQQRVIYEAWLLSQVRRTAEPTVLIASDDETMEAVYDIAGGHETVWGWCWRHQRRGAADEDLCGAVIVTFSPQYQDVTSRTSVLTISQNAATGEIAGSIESAEPQRFWLDAGIYFPLWVYQPDLYRLHVRCQQSATYEEGAYVDRGAIAAYYDSAGTLRTIERVMGGDLEHSESGEFAEQFALCLGRDGRERLRVGESHDTQVHDYWDCNGAGLENIPYHADHTSDYRCTWVTGRVDTYDPPLNSGSTYHDCNSDTTMALGGAVSLEFGWIDGSTDTTYDYSFGSRMTIALSASPGVAWFCDAPIQQATGANHIVTTDPGVGAWGLAEITYEGGGKGWQLQSTDGYAGQPHETSEEEDLSLPARAMFLADMATGACAQADAERIVAWAVIDSLTSPYEYGPVIQDPFGIASFDGHLVGVQAFPDLTDISEMGAEQFGIWIGGS